MILYDTFSVNISVENSAEDKIKLGIATQETRLITSQAQCEASSTSNQVNGNLLDDKTECIADMTAIVAHDDTKENLDPVSRTVSHNTISDNISLMNGVDDVDTMTDTWQCEHDTQTRIIPSDALGRVICNTSIDSNMGKDVNRSQSSRVDHRESIQRKSTSATEESCWLPYIRTIHNIDSDLNIARANKNVEKVLQNNVAVTMNRRVDKGSNSSLTTDGSPASHSRNLSYATASYRRNSSYTNSYRTGVTRSHARDRNIVNVPNIIFNEHSISNKQIDACDSSQLIQCMTFQENEYDDPTVRVSIELCKIQNLIDSKPELFASDQEDVDYDNNSDKRRRRCINRLHDEDDYMQQQTSSRDPENNDNTKYSLLRNSELQAFGQTDIEKIETRDCLYGSTNTFNRYRKRERESKYFDRRSR